MVRFCLPAGLGVSLSMVWLLSAVSLADEQLQDIACRSVHLAYAGTEVVAFANQVQVESSAPGTYFMVCGWDAGYFGMQELANGKKLILFSVWDNAQGDNPDAVQEPERVKLLHRDPAVRVKRFGGEGTGGQSFFDFDWRIGETYRFMVTCQPNENRTEYSGYFFLPVEGTWKKLVTFSTITGGKNMRSLYSFVEDFKRDRESTKQTRRAQFGGGWLKAVEGQWQAIQSARFTADANPVLNIDAGSIDGSRFFLATGGAIINLETRLRETILLKQTAGSEVPFDILKELDEASADALDSDPKPR